MTNVYALFASHPDLGESLLSVSPNLLQAELDGDRRCGVEPVDDEEFELVWEHRQTDYGRHIWEASHGDDRYRIEELPFELPLVAYQLNVEMNYGDGATRLDYLLFRTEEELGAATNELEDDLLEHEDVQVYAAALTRVLVDSESQYHSGPLADVAFIKEMREYLEMDSGTTEEDA